jgi:hypothetical protein
MNQKTRPQNRKEFMNSLVEPYDNKYGNPNAIFSEPKKAGQPENNRALEISSKKDTDKDFYIGIKDIDEAVMYYFKEVLKLSVIQNNTKIEVPILYANPENWKSAQVDGYYRDKDGKLMAPLLVFKRNSVTQNRTLGNKLDGNNVKNVQLFEKKYSKRNIYSNFNLLTSRSKEKEFIVSVIPDYVTVEYSCTVWTYFVEQMDKLIEALNFASRSYWGDPSKFQFYSSIETFTDEISYGVGDERAVKCSFNITLNGYLIPDSINKKMANATKQFSAAQIVFGLEVSNGVQSAPIMPIRKLANIIAADGQTIIGVKTFSQMSLDVNSFFATNKTKVADIITVPNQATFTGGSFLQPPDGANIPPTDKTSFSYFINGQYIPIGNIISFDGSNLVINASTLGFELSTDDEVVAIGKFA